MSVKRLKIALVTDSVLPFHKGGKETRIYHLSQALVNMGQDVHIYTMKWWDGDGTYTYKGVTYHALCRKYPLYVGEHRSIREGLMFGLACLKMVFHDFDILETDHMPYFPLFSTKLASILRRKPLYAVWHEVVGLRAWREYIGFAKGSIAYVIERLSVKFPDHILVVSEHTQKQLREVLHYTGRLSLVPNGIDYARIKPIKPSKIKSDICYVGRLIPHKNVDLLIKAVALLKASKPTIKCIIIGDGPELKKLQAMVREYALEDNITITGRLESSDDVYALMKSSKVFVSPSVREGFGITILEAYACGLTVVTVKHRDNAAQYLVKDGTGIVCKVNAEDIAWATRELLKARRKARTAIDAESYDWSRRAVELKEAYGL